MKKQQLDERSTASYYLARIEAWQLANGGFRRMPPESFDKKLSNWVQRCRVDFRRGKLNKITGIQLQALGVVMESSNRCIQPRPRTFDITLKMIDKLHSIGAEEDNSPTLESLHSDPEIRQWLNMMVELAKRNPQSILLSDLKQIIPKVYQREIEPILSFKEMSLIQISSTASTTIDDILNFSAKNKTLPNIFSRVPRERQLASWLIRIGNGLTPLGWYSTIKTKAQVEAMSDLTKLIASQSVKEREGQWRWWSSLAILTSSDVQYFGERWHYSVFNPEPESQAKLIGVDITKARQYKEGWDGGPWGVDLQCMTIAIKKANAEYLENWNVDGDAPTYHPVLSCAYESSACA